MATITHLPLGNGQRVLLAHEPSFRIGQVTVDPPTRQVWNGKRRELLEPRLMEVLVVLGRAEGGVVSRDELIECCWDGRIVGDDAINRVLSRLRQMASGIGANSFEIETIRGVGYCLRAGSDGTERHAERASRLQLSRRTIVAGSLTGGAALVAGAAWLLKGGAHQSPPLAREYYRRGLGTRGQISLELTEQGAAYFREATRIDPQFADAWGALAWSYRALLEFGPRHDTARLQALSRSAAARALALDPANADAQSALLLLKPFFRNWAELERGCRELLRSHPHNSILEFNLAQSLSEVGRWREAVPWLRSVRERERFWPLAHLRLLLALASSGMNEEAEDLVEEGMRRFPGRTDYWLCRIRYLAISGRPAEAIDFANNSATRPADAVGPAIEFELMIVRALADGSRAVRQSAIDAVTGAARQAAPFLPAAAMSAAALGNVDLAFDMLEGFYFGRGAWAHGRWERPSCEFLFNGLGGSLRADARFPQMLKEIGLEDYWRTTGTLPDYRRFA